MSAPPRYRTKLLSSRDAETAPISIQVINGKAFRIVLDDEIPGDYHLFLLPDGYYLVAKEAPEVQS